LIKTKGLITGINSGANLEAAKLFGGSGIVLLEDSKNDNNMVEDNHLLSDIELINNEQID